jgi:serine/threonine-protein kinase
MDTHPDMDATLPPGLKINTVFDGRYRIIDSIGHGGMGVVYRALDEDKGEQVAIKVLHSHLANDPEILWRFDKEAYSSLKINHPNVVEVKRSKLTAGGVPAYIVMELLQGETLRAVLRREGTLSLERAAAYMRPICDGVGAGHHKGIVHRDLKPENIMILSSGPVPVKVMDFGIAKLRFFTDTNPPTQPGQIMGTPRYMSPEQWDGRETDPRTDVYSLGVMFYEMLSGAAPFRAGDWEGMMKAHCNSPPEPLQDRQKIPHVDEVIMRALEKEPGRR